MINESIILNALNTAISKIERGDDPVVYLYRVQKVLNTMREMVYDKLDSSKMMCEPSEMFNITIRGSVRINRLGSEPVIVGYSPFILKVYGFRGLGIPDYRLAENYAATKDITDSFHWETIPLIRKNCYELNGEKDCYGKNVKEDRYISDHPMVAVDSHSIHIETHYLGDDRRELVFIMGARIHKDIVTKKRDEAAEVYAIVPATHIGISHVDRKYMD